MRLRFLVALVLFAAPTAVQGQAVPTTPVPLSQFRELSWLIGKWRGSGTHQPPFYEQYRFRDDSTIAMTAYGADSTFQAETADSSLIEWRQGVVQSRTPRWTAPVIELVAGRIRFRRAGTTDGGWMFTRVSPDEWAATIFPRGASRDTTTFRLVRVGE